MRKPALILTAVVSATAPAAIAQDLPGDPIRGRDLAERVCASCHRVEKGDRTRRHARAPAFQRVAREPSTTEMSLRVFLQTPHANMPNLVLSETETDDVMAYILSLK